MKPQIHIITLGVLDLEKSKNFYQKIFNLNPSTISNDNIFFFQLNGLVLALYPFSLLAQDSHQTFKTNHPSKEHFQGFTLAYNVTNKEDVDTLLNEIVNKGGKLLKPAQNVFWGGRSGYFADPDGYAWEIAWNPFFEIDGHGVIRLP